MSAGENYGKRLFILIPVWNLSSSQTREMRIRYRAEGHNNEKQKLKEARTYAAGGKEKRRVG